jgi:predicted amidohydrolase
MRARAIETGCFVVASAQSGVHPVVVGRPRLTYGHSLAVSPWGEVIADAGEAIGVTLVTLDPGEVTQARQRIASLDHARDFSGP